MARRRGNMLMGALVVLAVLAFLGWLLSWLFSSSSSPEKKATPTSAVEAAIAKATEAATGALDQAAEAAGDVWEQVDAYIESVFSEEEDPAVTSGCDPLNDPYGTCPA